MTTEIISSPSAGTVVWLHSLSTTRLNGQTALVVSETVSEGKEAAARGRCKVEVLNGATTVSVRLSNLSLSSPLFCIKEAPGKGGLGVYATQDITAGTGMGLDTYQHSSTTWVRH